MMADKFLFDVFVFLVLLLIYWKVSVKAYQKEAERRKKEIEISRQEWLERIEKAGGRRFYATPPKKPYGLYRAKWITPDGKEQWFTVGVKKGGNYSWLGNEISQASPCHINDFVEWFGPDEVWDEQ